MSVDNYSARQFAYFRVLFGLFIAYRMSKILPLADKLYSNVGIIPAPETLPHYSWPLSILSHINTPDFAKLFVGLALFLAILFVLGFARKVTTVLLLYCLLAMDYRNPTASALYVQYVNLLLLFTLFVPSGEGFALYSKKNENWKMPKDVYFTVMIAWGFLFSASGLQKAFTTPEWISGEVTYLHFNPKFWGGELPPINEQPFLAEMAWRVSTWTVLFFESMALPFIFFRKTRILISVLGATITPFIVVTMSVREVFIAPFFYQIFFFKKEWLREYSGKK